MGMKHIGSKLKLWDRLSPKQQSGVGFGGAIENMNADFFQIIFRTFEKVLLVMLDRKGHM